MTSNQEERNWLKERYAYLRRAPRSLCLVVHYETLEKINFDFSQLIELASVATSSVSIEHGEWQDGLDPLDNDARVGEEQRGSLIHENVGCLYDVDARAAIDMRLASARSSIAPVLVFTDSDAETVETAQEILPSSDQHVVGGDDAESSVIAEEDEDSLLMVTCQRPTIWLLKSTISAPTETNNVASSIVWERRYAPSSADTTTHSAQDEHDASCTTRVANETPSSDLNSSVSSRSDNGNGDDEDAQQLDDTCHTTQDDDHDEAEEDAHDETCAIEDDVYDGAADDASLRPSFEGAMCCDIMMVCDQVKCQIPSKAQLTSRLRELEDAHGCVAQVTLVAPALKELAHIWSRHLFMHASPFAIDDNDATAESTDGLTAPDALPRISMDDRELSLVRLLTTDHHVLSNSGERFLPDVREFLASYVADEPLATLVFFSDKKVPFDAAYLLSSEAD